MIVAGLTSGSVAFYFPRRVHVDGDGNVFVADGSLSNDDDTIRRIDAASNIVEGVAGGGMITPGSGAAVDSLEREQERVELDAEVCGQQATGPGRKGDRGTHLGLQPAIGAYLGGAS